MSDEWQDIDTAPENTWILCWCSYKNGEREPKMFVDKFQWVVTERWERESRTVKKLKEERTREWVTEWGAEQWKPLPSPPTD